MKHIIAITVIGFLLIATARAQISKVEQEVYGMDCAPCAYGLERGFKKMEGMQEVRVSLNDGKAYLGMVDGNQLTLADIQDEVKKNGFSAKKAVVSLSGDIKKEDGQWVIVTALEHFVVSQSTPAQLLQNLRSGIGSVSGTVQDKEDDSLSGPWSIVLSDIE